MKIPKIIVKKIKLEENVYMITKYISPIYNKNNTTFPFSKYCYSLFPELVGKINDDMTENQIRKIVKPAVIARLEKNKDKIEQKISSLQTIFDEIGEQLLIAIAASHDFIWQSDCTDVTCYIGYIPMCPKNVETKEYWLHFSDTNERMLKISVHEIGHFVFHEKWTQIYGQISLKDLDIPSPRWYLEEMIVDPLLNDERIQVIVPGKQKSYDQFYTETINGISINENLKRIKKESDNIEEFIKKSYEFVCDNINEINAKCN